MNHVNLAVDRVKRSVYHVELAITRSRGAVYPNVPPGFMQTFKKENAYRECYSALRLFYPRPLPFLNGGILCCFRCAIGCSICTYAVCSVCKEKWMLTKRGSCQPDGNQKCDTST